MSAGSEPDHELLSLWLSGDSKKSEQGFTRAYHKYQARIMSLALRITGDHSAAGDVVQETFITVFEKIHGFRGQSLFSSWLTRIGINFALERKRKDSRLVGFFPKGTEDEESTADGSEIEDLRGSSPEQQSVDREFEAAVQSIIQRLSDKYKVVVLLRYMEELSYEEVADVLQCSVGTVKSRLNRAHKMLEGTLGPVVEKFGLRSQPTTSANEL